VDRLVNTGLPGQVTPSEMSQTLCLAPNVTEASLI
jgi:hypothetical protein